MAMKYLLVMLSGLEFFDGVFTDILARTGLVREANPLMEPIIRKGDFLLFKITGIILCVPGYFGQIKRAETVTAKGRDQNGKEIRIRAEGLLAQALEHEIDHLNGLFYLDHLESMDMLHKIEPEETETQT